MQKGIIAAPARVLGQNSTFRFDKGLGPEDLRYLLLYWDKVVIPTTNLIHLALPEEEVLVETGAITRPRMAFSGNFNGETLAAAQVFAQTTVAKDLIKNDRSCDWTLHQLGDGILLPDAETIEKRLVRVDLIQALPVPGAKVPIAEILEFKTRRKDELLQLHSAIDDLYIEVLKSPDRDLASKHAVAKFRGSIDSLGKVTGEKWKVTSRFDLTAEVNLEGSQVAAGAAAGAAFDFFTQMFSIPVGTVIGAIASVIKIKAVSAKTFEPAKHKQVLGYLASARRDEILPNLQAGDVR